MRNNVVLCTNKTVKSNVLHPCVDTLKKKLQAFELQHMVQNILCRTSKERALIFYQNNLRQKKNFSPLRNNREIETKVLPQFNRPISIKSLISIYGFIMQIQPHISSLKLIWRRNRIILFKPNLWRKSCAALLNEGVEKLQAQ